MRYSFYLHKLYWNIKEKGILASFKKLLHGILGEILQGSEHLFYLDLSDFQEKKLLLPQNVEISFFTKKEEIPEYILGSLKEFVQKEGMKEEIVDYYVGEILDLYKDGGTMYVAIVDNNLAAYSWSMTYEGNYTPYFPFFPFIPGDTVLFGAMTLPRYRGQGLFPMILRHGIDHFKKTGKKRVYCSCKAWNTASFRSCEKVGLKELAVARRVEVFGRCISIWARN